MKEIALIGNPNVGKSSLFHKLTKENVYIGNWPGVTVEKKEGLFKYKDEKFKVIDLPGLYTLSSEGIDQKIAIDYLINNKPDLVINILDSTALEKNLYLTLELLDLGIKPLLVLNKIDKAEELGIKIDVEKLKEKLNLEVIPISVIKDINIDKLIEKIYELSKKQGDKKITLYSKEIEEKIKKLEEKFKDKKISRFLATKELGDEIVKERYRVIEEIIKECVKVEKKEDITNLLDEVILSKYGYLVMIPIFWLLFNFTFKTSAPLVDLISLFFNTLASYIKSLGNNFFINLLADGVIEGVGTVLSFIPILAFMFIFLAILEESGYLSRVPYLLDSILKKLGLPGEASIPLIISYGCNVPGVIATRVIRDRADRIITAIISPFIPCTARLPIFAFFIAMFFKSYQGILLVFYYFLGLFVAIFLTLILRRVVFKTPPMELIIELPHYNVPTFSSIFRNTWFRVKAFLYKASTIILLGSILIYLLTYPTPENSLSYYVGETLSHIFIQNWDWRAVVSLIYGVIAKELVVSSLEILYKGNLSFTLPSALSYLVFSLLYFPCIATLATLKSEVGWKWALFSMISSLLIAYILSSLIYAIASLILG
ncbi:ferrous iron transport protein B [Methanocaldococcus infernus ME]|uniref:Ferrous iron transport protein B n=1 Tax=Methanocaldococcus infernus (strain DSM 11812 / JCM 15783 / ME) TaxID=573063 RepID=D5VST8_METIM|nr:ferrous iron transport protein B [Methanocaldococcus infernus]ADG13641.1 ferrous iron transport protein B [Methanocaldococcus infernus ME]